MPRNRPRIRPRIRLRTGAFAAAGLLGALLLPAAPLAAAPQAPARPSAQGWIEEDPGSADLRLDTGAAQDAPLGASLEREPGDGPVALATFPARDLDRAVDELDVAIGVSGPADGFSVEVRGERAEGVWGEWVPVAGSSPGAVAEEQGVRVRLPHPADRVQVRVGLSGKAAEGGSVLEEVRLRPVGAADGAADGGLPGEPFSARLFATRIGLVGATTANGHTVRADDHFVALPSRRALAPRGSGDYTVRVCTEADGGDEVEGDGADGRRCAYAPVWDVGPWNIKDDHWNTDRQMWRDLPHGTPQAQAAYKDGYNGGRDGFGRKVLNPAGIDLADGTFRDALKLPTNAWVRVDYLWTGDPRPRARMAAADGGDPVVVRSGPGRDHPATGMAAEGARVAVECRTAGERVDGPAGAAAEWLRIGEGDFVPAAFAEGGGAAPECALP
ncbi:hypothetical protein O4J56_09935 [Nocardiopsis sp. RSe5-2]|uniref:Ig-like domain-containing protein n=1 Tax=Nocardiopsis endophytica TaxID=3018445 RepID=A0ABT4U1Y9_9ACTN|nr:hypothetical protein [Nocardiopsis endophytica]MDA2810955.1 hypothetical protein [Nocardiopsis endophytica]